MRDAVWEAKKVLTQNGYHIYKNKIWKNDPQFVALKARAKELDIPGIPDDRAFFLLEIARKLKCVSGDIVECGVRFGKSTFFILGGTPERRMEVFDSFEGLSAPSEVDGEHWTEGGLAVQLDRFKNSISDHNDRVTIHKGWIPETLGQCRTEEIAFLHLDLDLHLPTKAALEFFYPRMVSGGVIVCDDYGSTLCPGAKLAFDDFFADKPEKPVCIPTAQCFVYIK
jgi:O-methyltransferase